MPKKIDLTGQRFGRLVVLREAGRTPNGHTKWLCKCECGSVKAVDGADMRYGRIKSCGCLKSERAASMAHARVLPHKKHPLYTVWHDMKARCYNPNNEYYGIYGGRGIEVCPEWRDNYELFYAWAMEAGWKPGLTVDRIDNNKGYEPNNCRIATMTEQIRNRRMTVCIEFRGESKPFAQWCDELEIPYQVLYHRLYRAGWSVERALTEPVHKNKKS